MCGPLGTSIRLDFSAKTIGGLSLSERESFLMKGQKKRSIIESSIIKPKGNVMDEKLVSAEAILRHLVAIKKSEIYTLPDLVTGTNTRGLIDELIDHIERDLDEMLDDMYKESQERNRQIEVRLDDAFENQDRFGDVIAGGSF